MATLEIPFQRTPVPFSQRVLLDTVPYVLSFKYNSRTGLYTMDITSADGTVLLAGIVLLNGVLLTLRYLGRIAGLPEGNFVVIDETEQGRDLVPDVGKEVKLIYIEA